MLCSLFRSEIGTKSGNTGENPGSRWEKVASAVCLYSRIVSAVGSVCALMCGMHLDMGKLGGGVGGGLKAA